MIRNYVYTDSEKKQIMSSIVFLFDTREQSNDNIKQYFDKHKIEYKTKKLDFGDYSFMVKAIPELGIVKDLSFANEVVIERKNSLDEIASNLTSDRTRLEREFAICPAKIKLLIEKSTYKDLITGNYNSKYNPKAFEGTLHSFQHRYNMTFDFIDSESLPRYIYCYFHYYLKGVLK